MRRFLFYFMIIGQIVVISFLTYQFEQIDKTGYEIRVQTLKPDFPVYGDFIDGDMYVEYDINEISEEQWHISSSIDYNTPVYILLRADKNGVYRAHQASTNKLTANNQNEFVLKGTYQYHDTKRDIHYVNYGMERIKHADQFGIFRPDDELVVTLLIGKWGQHKVTAIEKRNGL